MKTFSDISIQQQVSTSVNQPIHQQTSESGLSSLFSILPSSASDITPTDEQQQPKPKKKKKRMPRLN